MADHGARQVAVIGRRQLLRNAAGAAALAAASGSLVQRAFAATAPPEWSNWSGSVRFTPAEKVAPTSVAEVQAAVARAAKAGRGVRAIGSGHSFTPLCETQGLQLVTSRLRGVESVDTARREAWLLGGSKLYQVGEPLRKAGLALSTMPDIDRQALAGSIATGTHGTGRTIGSLSSYVTGVRLVLASGDTLEATPDKHPEIFRAAQVSLGALGVITHVRLALEPAFRLRERNWTAPFEACMAQLESHVAQNRHFEFFWFPDPNAFVPAKLPKDLCGMKSLNPTKEPRDFERWDDAAQTRGERVGWSDTIYASPRDTAFNEIEFAIPAERGPDCVRELRQLMLTKHKDALWPLEYRTVKPDEALLSPDCGRATVTISAHQAAERPYRPYFDDVEAIFRNHGGRPHWGKIHKLGAKELAPLYPKWDAFQRVRKELDPKGVFLNAFLRKVLVA
ncbi:MAG: FAD-binding protein [Deltaproteobacteria bacterium]|nr:FAD-binding protein [Deltaproteobacteria bacterium]